MAFNADLLIYAVHGAFWGSFGVTRRFAAHRAGGPADAPMTEAEASVPRSRALLLFHSVAFGVMYFGVGSAAFTRTVPAWFTGQRLAGTLVIGLGAAMACWSLFWFRSWRFRAKLDVGHQLATGGPFRLVRHPIYLGLDLLALGSAIWIPTAACWLGALLMVIGSDLRGRAEERLLTAAFGEAYSTYTARTARFLPGVY